MRRLHRTAVAVGAALLVSGSPRPPVAVTAGVASAGTPLAPVLRDLQA